MIIGLTGTFGAGKDTVAEYLVAHKGYKSFSARGVISEEVENRGLVVDRDTLRQVANDLASMHGPDFIAKMLYKKALQEGGDVVFESLRRPAEATFLKQQGNCTLMSVDANPKTRYERIQNRGNETDSVSFDEFIAQEEKEMKATIEYEQNIAAVIAMADVQLTNNGTKEELYRQIEKALASV